MYLSALELNGFKSFPNRTKLEFAPGVMAIVGPNGCGKSNLVDAVRWVLGEQRSSILRSDKMESVIFSGANGKKAANYAEVTLVIENTENLLPSEYTQVSITRKLNRNGDSEYQINRRPARLKDIRELFADTGLGPDSYSIIELAMVNSILSSKPEERRRLFEEAAGVTLYKTRLKASMNRLDATQTNLIRLEDVIREVESQRNTLKRQVARAKRYRFLKSALRAREIKAASSEIMDLRSRIVPMDAKIQKERASLVELDKRIESSEQNLAKKRGRLASLEEQLSTILSEHRELEAATRERERDIATLDERIANIKRVSDQRDREREEIEGRLSDYSIQIKELHEKREDARIELRNRTDKHKEVEDTLHEQVEVVNSKRLITAEADEERQQTKTTYNRLENEISRIHSIQERLKARLTLLSNDNDKPQIVDVDEKRLKVKSAEKITLQIEKEVQSLSDQISELREQRKTAQDHLTKTMSRTRALEERVGLLESIVEKGKGRPRAVESLLTSGIADIRGRLGDFIQVEEQYRLAVSSVLGEYASSILLNSRMGLVDSVKFLKEDDRGSALLALLPADEESEFEEIHIEQGGISPIRMSEVVSNSDQVPHFIHRLFHSTFIVKSHKELLHFSAETYDKNCSLVTLEGDLLDFDGIYHIGIKSESDLGAHSMLENANNQLSEMGAELDRTTVSFENIETEINELSRIREVKSHDLREKREETKRINSELSKLEADLRAQEALQEQKRKEIAEITEELHKYENQLSVLHQNEVEAKTGLDSAEEQFLQFRSQLLTAEANVQEIRDNHELGIREIGRAETGLERIEGEVRRLGGMFRELEARKKQLSEGREEAIQANEDPSANLKNVQAEFEILKTQLEQVSLRLKEVRKSYSATQTQVSEFDGFISEFRRERDRLNDAIHAADIELHDLNHRISSVKEKVQDTYEIDLTAPLQQNLELRIEEDNPYADLPLGELREKLKTIGAVNEMAVEEFDEIDRRYQDLRTQVDDLLSAKDQLEETIQDINNVARDQFTTTFDRVNENFNNLFKRMFEGGEAGLTLDDGDPLEAGIRIYATPKGKKLSNIELMSGGEKALTAISLLFSLYMERPSPFCFLDEVDAPLDDVNVVRFNKLLREFTNSTQFLMVTHNKLTMERTDRIYGITMEQEGISKLIAVQLGKMKEVQ